MTTVPWDDLTFRKIEPRIYDTAVGDNRPPGGAYAVCIGEQVLGEVRRKSEASHRRPRGLRYTTGLLGYPRTWYVESDNGPTPPNYRGYGPRFTSHFHYSRRSAVEALWRHLYG